MLTANSNHLFRILLKHLICKHNEFSIHIFHLNQPDPSQNKTNKTSFFHCALPNIPLFTKKNIVERGKDALFMFVTFQDGSGWFKWNMCNQNSFVYFGIGIDSEQGALVSRIRGIYCIQSTPPLP